MVTIDYGTLTRIMVDNLGLWYYCANECSSVNLKQSQGSSPMAECKQTNGVHQTQTSVIVRCGLLALEATNLSVIANELQRTYFKSEFL